MAEVLAQDAAQNAPSKRYEDQKKATVQYREDLNQYHSDLAKFETEQIEYQKQLKEYEAEVARIEAEEKAEQDRIQKQRDAETAVTAKFDAEIKVLQESQAAALRSIPTHYWKTKVSRSGNETKVWSRRLNQHISDDRQKVKKQFSGKIEKIQTQKQLASYGYEYRRVYGTRPIRTSEYNLSKARGISLVAAVENKEEARKQTTAYRILQSKKEAQSNAIKAAQKYSSDPKNFASSITQFGGTDVRKFSQEEIKRRDKIKPLEPKTPSILAPRLEKSTNRPLHTGITFGIDSPQDAPTKPTQQSQRNIIASYLQQYKGTQRPPATVLEAQVLNEKQVLLPETKQLIKDISSSKSAIVPYWSRTSTIKEKKSGQVLDTKTGKGSFKIAKATGFTSSYNVPTPIKTKQSYTVAVMPSDTPMREIDLSKLSYSELIDKGIAKKPDNAFDQIKYYASRSQRPITTIPDSLALGGQYRQESFEPSTIDRLIINAEQSIKNEKPIEQGLKETARYAKKDPLGVAAELPAETALFIGGGKLISLGSKGILKVSEKVYSAIKPYVKNEPTIDKSTGKIYPRNQKPLTREQVNRPLSKAPTMSFTKEIVTLGKAQSKPPKFTPRVQEDPTYRPASRANEININDSKLYGFDETRINLGKAQIKSKAPVKPTEVVKIDKSYRPASRANEININDSKLYGFEESKIGLGKSQLKAPPVPKSKAPVRVVTPDESYKPASRANEIDVTSDTALGEFTRTPINLGRSTVRPPAPDKKIKRDKSYQPPRDVSKLKQDLLRDNASTLTKKTTGFGSGALIQSGKQSSIIIKKQKQITKQKTKPIQGSPLPLDYTVRTDSRVTPSTGSAPLKLITKKQKKKKQSQPFLYSSAGVVVAYESIKTPVQQSTGLGTLNQIKVNVAVDTKSNIASDSKLKVQTRQTPKERSIESVKLVNVQKPKQKQRPTQRFTFGKQPKRPTRSKNTTRFVQPKKPKQKTALSIPAPQRGIPVTAPPVDKRPKRKRDLNVGKKSKTKDFIGNVPTTKIVGIYGERKDIVYGAKKVKKYSDKELRKEITGIRKKKSSIKTKVKVF